MSLRQGEEMGLVEEVEAMPTKVVTMKLLKVAGVEDAVMDMTMVEVAVKVGVPWADQTTPRQKYTICWNS
jgi:hypothetical protein